MPKQEQLSPESSPATEKSIGEKRFDRLVYAGLNGVGTFVVTLPLAYWAKYGKGVQFFEKAEKKLIEAKFSSKNIKDILETTALGLGGTVMVLPVKLAESFRTPLVNWLSPNEQEKAKAQDHLQHVPVQTWSSLILGRVTAWVAVYTSIKGVNALAKKLGNEQALGQFEDAFAKNVVCKPLGKTIVTEADKTSKLYRYGKLAALDIFATAAATTLLYIGSRFFAKYQVTKQPDPTLPAEPVRLPHPLAVHEAAQNWETPVLQIQGEKEHDGPMAETARARA